MNYRILAINPGSTSTKIAIYDNYEKIFVYQINYNRENLSKYKSIYEQHELRKNDILNILNENNIKLDTISAIVGRGGLLPPLKSGAYAINKNMIDTLTNNPILEHASNLGAIIAYEIARYLNIESYIYDPVSVDELSDIAKISGIKGLERSSLSHALNSRAMAIKYCKENNKSYKNSNIIVAHLGGGISISIHSNGKMIDIVSDDEGPFSPERSGRIQCKKLIDLCFSNKYTYDEILKLIRGKGGIYSHLSTVNIREVEKMINEGNQNAKLIYEAMTYQISKGIGELATVVNGNVDSIILTGGMAYSDKLTNLIKERIKFISKIFIFPGENELESLVYGLLRVLNKEEKVNIYK